MILQKNHTNEHFLSSSDPLDFVKFHSNTNQAGITTKSPGMTPEYGFSTSRNTLGSKGLSWHCSWAALYWQTERSTYGIGNLGYVGRGSLFQ